MDKNEIGYLEFSHLLEKPTRTFNQKELLDAAEASQLRNTGWPIGIVLRRPGAAPVSTTEGIESKIGDFKEGQFDYWSLSKDGKFYFLRKFEEDTEHLTGISPPPPERAIWWDVRVWRIAEIFNHSAALYKSLGIPSSSPFSIVINHKGLTRRVLFASKLRYFRSRTKVCSTSEISWQKTLTQEVILGGLKDLVFQVTYDLLLLFDFVEVSRENCNQIVDDFMKSRL